MVQIRMYRAKRRATVQWVWRSTMSHRVGKWDKMAMLSVGDDVTRQSAVISGGAGKV